MKSLSESQVPFFTEVGKLFLKFILKSKGHRLAETILKRRTKVEGLYFLISKLTTKLQYSKQCGNLHQDTDQQDRIESTEINMSLFIYVELIFNKGTRPSKGERIVSSINGAGTIEYPHAKRMRQDPYLTPLTNIHSK